MTKNVLPGLIENMQIFPRPVSRIAAIGSYLPPQVISNQDIANLVDAPPQVKKKLGRIIERVTGIKYRRYAPPGTSPSELAYEAAVRALDRAGFGFSEIDTLIFSSTDMDMLEPATANILQQRLGIRAINAFDVSNACNSFLQAMNVANSLIASGAAHRVLIATGEVGSHWVNRSINELRELDVKMGGFTLGDAGAAIVMEPANGEDGLLEINLLSLGEYWETCHAPDRASWRKSEDGSIHGWFYLDMPELARVARENTVQYFNDYISFRREAHAEDSFLDFLTQVVPHQISPRFIEEIGRAVMVKPTLAHLRKVCVTCDSLGNTASTAIPVAIARLIEEGTLEFGTGQEVLLYGAASGFGIGHIRIRL